VDGGGWGGRRLGLKSRRKDRQKGGERKLKGRGKTEVGVK